MNKKHNKKLTIVDLDNRENKSSDRDYDFIRNFPGTENDYKNEDWVVLEIEDLNNSIIQYDQWFDEPQKEREIFLILLEHL